MHTCIRICISVSRKLCFGIYGDLPKPFPCIVKTNIWKKERVEVFFWISRWTNNEHSQKILRQNIPGNHWPEFKDEYS